MQTDPVTAATRYRQALDLVLKADILHKARQIASQALGITFNKAEGGQISVQSGYGLNTNRPFVTIGIANPTESANPIVQLVSSQARQIALQILEAADAADADGFILTWLGNGVADLNAEQAAALLADFRAYRDRLRGAEGEQT